jgi:phospholipase A1/A2
MMFKARHKSIISGYLILIILLAVSTRAQEDSQIFQMVRTGPGLSLHKELFMLPVTYSDAYNSSHTEAVFQLSAKYRVLNTPIYFGYTQISFWQAYDYKHSAPFRETNYNPEIFYRSNRFPFEGGEVGADIGFEHESNGQIPPISRSWNLAYISPYYYRSNFLMYLKFRYRFHEDEKKFSGDFEGDDNPDITDYLGYCDAHIFYKFPWNHQIHLRVQGNVSKGRGGIALNYSIHIPKSDMSYFILRISQGYGESLVDYKKSLTRIGLGIMFSR